jgi:hypothetical protein
VGDVLIRSHDHQASGLPIDAAHSKDVIASLDISAKHFFVVTKPITSLPRQKQPRHGLDSELTMKLLEHRAEIDHRVDVLVARGVLLDGRIPIRGTLGRWHIHCAIELPSHFDGIALESLIRDCWAKVEWGYDRILVRDGANAGWINYMLKDRQKSAFDGFVDCIIIESLHNPIADA